MNNIRDMRIKKKITQHRLASMIGVDRSTVAKWETNASAPRADKLLELARLLECSVEDLLRRINR